MAGVVTVKFHIDDVAESVLLPHAERLGISLATFVEAAATSGLREILKKCEEQNSVDIVSVETDTWNKLFEG
jgi:hypothetical protein